MKTSWITAALLPLRPFIIVVLSSCLLFKAEAQVTIWQENFAGANQGWTDNFVDCDGTMQSFAGVANGRYEVTDMEGAPCCAPQGGGNENEWVTNPIDIEDYCSVDISVTYGFIGVFECSAGGPYFGCQANPTINNGHDQIVFEYSINGGAWVQFGYVCGGQAGTVTATGLVGNDIRIRIRPSNKSTAETYWFDNVTVTGNVGPTVNEPADVTACANTVVNVPFTGSAGATFSWTNNNTAIGLGASGTGNINFTTANVGAVTTGTITVTPINGCNGQPVTFDITVQPVPVVNDPPNQVVCSNQQVNVVFTGNAGTYNWTNSNPAIGLPATGSGDINFTANAGPAVATITVQPVQGLCIGTTQTFTITVNNGPTINAVADVTTCGGGAVNVPFTGTPGAQYTWTNSNPAIGLPANGTGNVVFTSANPANVETGTITVTPAIGACQGAPEIFTITVNPTPTVVDPPNQTVCGGEQVNVVFTGNGAPVFNWTNSNTAIGLGASGSGNIGFTAANVTANTVGNITVTPIANGCTGAAQNFTLTVTPVPVATQPADVTVCAGTNVMITLAGQPAAAVLSWTNSNPAIGLPASGTGNITFNAAAVATQQTALITVTPTFGLCTGVAVTFDITINPTPEVNLNPTNLAVCGGAPILLDLLANASPGAALTWTNNNTNTGIPASGTGNINETAAAVTAVQVSTVVITPTLGACTGPTETATVTVSPTPTVAQPADQTVCGGQNVAVTLTGQPAGTAITWTNDNTAIGLGASGSGNINFVAAQVANAETGQITVTPTLGACTGTAQTFDITINPTPEVNLNPTALAVCGGQPIDVDLAANATPGATFTWTNNNVNTGIPASGSGNINETAAAVANAEVSVVTVTPTLGVCAGTPETVTVTVNPTPTVTQPADQTVCGGANVAVTLSGQPAGAAYSWTNSNPAIGLPASGSGNINFVAAAVGNAETGLISITPTLGACTGIVQTFSITVNPTPEANLNPTALAVCGGEPIQVNLLANATPGATIAWTNNNTNTGIPASGSGNIDETAAAVTTAQVSIISVTPTLGVCSGPAETMTVTVNPTPTVNQPGDETVCGGENVVVAFSGQPAGAIFSWTNDNPAIGLPASGSGNINFVTGFPANQEIGQITVTPTLGLCTGTALPFNITVEPTPVLNLNPASSAACGGEPIQIDFEANALPGTTFTWTNNNTDTGIPASGTGNINEIAAIVTADEVSVINITPTLGLCTGLTETYTFTVVPEPTVLNPGDENACGGQTVSIPFSGTNGAAFNWTNDNPAIGLPAFGSGPINFTAAVVGNPEVATIIVTPTLGACTGDPVQFNITVDLGPQLTLNPTNLSACGGEQIQVDLAANATPGSSFTWTNSNPAIGLPAAGSGNIDFITAVVAAPQTGVITIIPTIGACSGAPQQLTVVVVTTPEVNLAPASLTVCGGEPILSNFAANATPGAAFAWTNNNTATGIPAAGSGNINATANVVAVPTVSNIAVTPSLGACVGTPENYTVTVVPEPTVVNPGNLTFCGGETVNLAFSGTPGSAVSWTNDNPAIGLPASGSGNLNFTSANPTVPDSALITLTPVLGACDGPPETFLIIVNPVPVVSSPVDSSLCGLTAVNIPFNGSVGAVFTWTNDNTAIGLPASGVGDLNFTSTDVASSTTANIEVTANIGACESTPVSFELTLIPSYVVLPQADAASCGGQTLNVAFASTGGNPPVSWTNNNPAIGLPGSGTGNISFVAPLLPTDETAQIVVTPFQGTPGCYGPNDTFSISIVTSPAVNNPGNQNLCGGAVVNVPLVGTPSAVMGWTNDNPAIGLPASGTGNLSFTSANVAATTTATITVSPVLNGCVGADQVFVITINPAPLAGISGASSVCDGNSTTLTASGGIAYQWAGGPATAAYTVAPINTTVYTVTVTGSGGCTDVANTTVAVLPLSNTIQNLQSCNPADTGIVIDILVNQFGCDSVVTSITTLLPTDTTMINLVTCNPNNAGSISFVVPN
ncbi:MAG: beta strand repeat-containing protein, partial [Saprospiraceae bacterium]